MRDRRRPGVVANVPATTCRVVGAGADRLAEELGVRAKVSWTLATAPPSTPLAALTVSVVLPTTL